MLTSPKSPRFRAMPRPSHIVPSGAVFLLASMMLVVTMSSASERPAGATEFEPKPVLEIQSGCDGNAFHFHVQMYNQGNDWTTFTVSFQLDNGPITTVDHQVAGGDVEMLDFAVPELHTGTLLIIDPDGSGINELREITAKCVPVPTSTSTTTSSTTTSTSTSTTSTSTTTIPAIVKTTTSTVPPSTSTTSTTTTAVPVAVEAATVVRGPAAPAGTALAVTGNRSTPLGWIGVGLLALGLAIWLLSARLQYAYQD